jgi:hypothetical protein
MTKAMEVREAQVKAENAAKAAARSAEASTEAKKPPPPKKNRLVDDTELLVGTNLGIYVCSVHIQIIAWKFTWFYQGMAGRLQKELKRINEERNKSIDLLSHFLKKDPDQDGYLGNDDVLKILRNIGWKKICKKTSEYSNDVLNFFSLSWKQIHFKSSSWTTVAGRVRKGLWGVLSHRKWA